MNDQKVSVPADLLQAITGYLVKRPFEEVAGMIGAIQQAVQGDQPRNVPPPAK